MKADNTLKIKGDSLIIIEVILCFIIVYATILYNSDLVSYAFIGSFILLLYHFILFITKVSQNNQRINILITIIVISFINILISTILAGLSVSFVYFQSYFIFLSSPILFCLAVDYQISEKAEKTFFILQGIIALAYPYCYNFVLMRTNHTNNLAFNFSNPNLAGMFILPTVLYMILGAIRFKSKYVKAIFIILAIININMMIKTGCRNTLLSLTIFSALILWAYIKKKYIFPNWLLAFFSYIPGLFVPVYLLFINVVIEKGWLSFLVSKGKKLNSRVGVWESFLEKLDGKWLTGNYAKAAGNAHNSHMVLLCSFGIIVVVLVIILLYRILQEVNKKSSSLYDICCISAFCAVLFMGVGEGAIYSGGQGIYILCGSFLFLINREDSKEELINSTEDSKKSCFKLK